MNLKIDFSDFIQPEYEKIIELARFTDEQKKVFDLLNCGRWNDEGIMRELCFSRDKYYKTKKKVIAKVTRVIPYI